MRIVTNGHGLYAIKRGFWFFSMYKDLHSPYWWFKVSQFYPDCWGTLEQAQEEYGYLKPYKV